MIYAVAQAPAFAASPCTVYTMDYNSLAGVSETGFTLGGVTVTTSMSTSTANGGTVLPYNGDLGTQVRQTTGSTQTTQLGSTTHRNLLFNLDGRATATLAITFSKPVRNLTLTFRDVTSNPSNRSLDYVAFSPAAAQYTNITNSSPPVGVSSTPGPLYRTASGSNDGSKYYDASATFAGSLSAVNVTYSNNYTGGGEPGTVAMGLYQVSFCV